MPQGIVQMLKILFDRNVFNRGRYEKLRNSNLLALSTQYTLLIPYNEILFLETADYALSPEGNYEKMREHLLYLLMISNGRWFNGTDEIIRKELEGNANEKYPYYYTPIKEQRRRIKNIKMNMKLNKFSTEDEIEEARNKMIEFRNQFRKGVMDFRNTVFDDHEYLKKVKTDSYTFDDFYEENLADGELDSIIRLFTDKKVFSQKLYNKQEKYPYFWLFVKGCLFMYYQRLKLNRKSIDFNDRFDLEQLVFMKDLDIMVSNESGFMRGTFNVMYGDTKRYLGLEEFLDVLNSL